jgi:hypothetical protein
MDAIFVSDRVPSARLSLRKDGTFAIQEPGVAAAGTYAINGSSLTLQPSGGQAMVGTQFDGKGFLDPHGSHWSRQ